MNGQRGLQRLPAGPGNRASTIASTRGNRLAGQMGTPSPLAGGAGDGVPVGRSGANRSVGRVTQ